MPYPAVQTLSGVDRMKISVTRDKNNDTEIVLLDLKDVLYIETENRNLVYHTHEGVYYHLLPSLNNMSKYIEPAGFMRLDRNNMVNLNQVKNYDGILGKVYFDKDVKKDSKYATISILNRTILKRTFEKLSSQKDNNNTE